MTGHPFSIQCRKSPADKKWLATTPAELFLWDGPIWHGSQGRGRYGDMFGGLDSQGLAGWGFQPGCNSAVSLFKIRCHRCNVCISHSSVPSFPEYHVFRNNYWLLRGKSQFTTEQGSSSPSASLVYSCLLYCYALFCSSLLMLWMHPEGSTILWEIIASKSLC